MIMYVGFLSMDREISKPILDPDADDGTKKRFFRGVITDVIRGEVNGTDKWLMHVQYDIDSYEEDSRLRRDIYCSIDAMTMECVLQHVSVIMTYRKFIDYGVCFTICECHHDIS